MKFKVGDRVRVVRSNQSKFDKWVGTVSTINRIFDDSAYPYRLDGCTVCDWCDSELELASFSKSDLKDGMVVEYCNGERRMVIGDILIGYSIHNPLSNYTDTLETGVSPCVINKVYKSTSKTLNCYFDDKYLELVWERPKEEPIKEMTVAEIEKELGYKVKIKSED